MSDEHKRYLDKLSQEHLQSLGYDATDSDSEESPQNPAKKPVGTQKSPKSADYAQGENKPGESENATAIPALAGQTEDKSVRKSAGNANALGDAQDPYRVKPGLGTLIRHLLRRIFKGHR